MLDRPISGAPCHWKALGQPPISRLNNDPIVFLNYSYSWCIADARALSYYHRICSALDSHGIAYTLHWGQMHNFTSAGISRMYEQHATQWIACRNKWLKPEVMKVFTNDFLRRTGWDGIFPPGELPPAIV